MERILRDKLPGGRFEGVPASRSRHMAAIKGKGNKTTERRFRALLVRGEVRGWTMQTKELPGKPDFYFRGPRVAVFLDGCFWHGCPRCGHVPNINRPFWFAKITRNQQRDREKDRQLEVLGIRVLRLWEHELQEERPGCLQRLKALLGAECLQNASPIGGWGTAAQDRG